MKSFIIITFSAIFMLSVQLEAAPTICTGNLIGGTYDGVKVPAGESCLLAEATVNGDIVADGHKNLQIFESEINGNVRPGNGTGGLIIGFTTVNGDIRVDGYDSSSLISIFLTNVKGNLSTENNHFSSNSIYIDENEIKGNLSVMNNNFDRVWAALNTIEGNLSVQNNVSSSAIHDNIVAANEVNGNLLYQNNFTTGLNDAPDVNPHGSQHFVLGSGEGFFGVDKGFVKGNVIISGNRVPEDQDGGVLAAEIRTAGNLILTNNISGRITAINGAEVGGNLVCANNTPNPVSFDPLAPPLPDNIIEGKNLCKDLDL